MIGFLVRRFATIPLVVLGVVTILFVIFKSVPGDEAAFVAGATATQVEIEAVRVQLGLDRPLAEQYARHISGLVVGNFGYSTTFRGNPLPRIVERLPATLALAAAAIALTIIIGIPAGVLAAAYRNKWVDYVISLTVVGLLAVPNFWLGMILISWLSVELGLLPSFGAAGPASLIIPTLALAARLIALVARMTRGVVIEELRKDYVRTARAKGLSRGQVLTRHVLRNVMIPTVTVIGLQAGYLLGGSVVIERLCAWPGIGDLLLNAVSVRDYTLVQGIVLIFVVSFLVINIGVEIIYRLVNPRLRYA
jgi:ABC-type dipeptide/oligopeptide/nickel transport system permease component